jgi:hypothetical protein
VNLSQNLTALSLVPARGRLCGSRFHFLEYCQSGIDGNAPSASNLIRQGPMAPVVFFAAIIISVLLLLALSQYFSSRRRH